MKDNKLYLIHILECIRRIEDYTQGGKDEFFTDIKTQDAVFRNLQTLGESAKRLSAELKRAHPGIDWRNIRGFRNVLVHDYLRVDPAVVWRIIQEDLPSFGREIAAILEGQSESANGA